jgi:hypothetical protein
MSQPFKFQNLTKPKPQLEKYAFNVYCLSTFFVVIFSVHVISFWPPLVEKVSTVLACLLPLGMVVFSRASIWLETRTIPKEFVWVAIVFLLGVLSSILSEDTWGSFKTIVLFMISGPLVFLVTKYLFESSRNQKIFLWIASLAMLILVLFGFYQHFTSGIVYVFSRNPLPAGALLILLSAGPLALLSQKPSLAVRFFLGFILLLCFVLIVYMGKKSHILAIIALLIFFTAFIFRKQVKLVLIVAFFTACGLFFSGANIAGYKGLDGFEESVSLRAENYFFGLHVFTENPFWGIGPNANFDPYFSTYELKFPNHFSKKYFSRYIKTENTFENIFIAFLVWFGGLFSIVYFGGVFYILIFYLKNGPPFLMHKSRLFVISVVVGFIAMSFTFDTLRFPNLNWMLHSFLGLVVSFSSFSVEDRSLDSWK